MQEYWDHYPYWQDTNPGNTSRGKRKINCIAHRNPNDWADVWADQTDGSCASRPDNVYPWPTASSLFQNSTSTNYGLDHPENCSLKTGETCGDLIFGNYYDSANNLGYSMIPAPGVFLEDIRTQWRTLYSIAAASVDAPILNSGWRNPERNEAVGGVINSNHQWSPAADIKPVESKYTTVYNGTQEAAVNWCRLAWAAYLAGGTAENIIENKRKGRPGGDTYRFQYYWKADSSLIACTTAVTARIEACLNTYGDGPYKDSELISCSPDHVHTAKP